MSARNDMAVRQQAIAWFVRLHSGEATEDDRRDCEIWQRQNPQHEAAWARLNAIRGALTEVPQRIAMSALQAERADRRLLLKAIALFAVGSGASWVAVRERPWEPYLAAQRTEVGERRELTLDDGSTLAINTASAVDLRFDARTRLVFLLEGEILVQTAHASGERRPFVVQTRHGLVHALGTRFIVRRIGERTEVSVIEHAVEIRRSPDSPPMRLEAGQRLAFDRQASGAIDPVAIGADAWVRGQLLVNDRPLREVIAELSRYRRGHLRCAPAVAGIRVSGVFPLQDTDRALAMLAGRFPISISSATRYWVTVDAPG